MSVRSDNVFTMFDATFNRPLNVSFTGSHLCMSSSLSGLRMKGNCEIVQRLMEPEEGLDELIAEKDATAEDVIA